jgi:GrpB-like predicted nucleotidyltransferase (UPF0157 family)
MSGPNKLTVLPHDPTWKDEFSRTKVILEQILANVPIRSIEHVGSTSIVGLPAKPIIDIDIIVEEQHVDSARQAMVAAGYLDLGTMDIPGRWVLREPGWAPGEGSLGARIPGKGLRRNTYIIIDGYPSLRNHLDVKRILEENSALRQEYGAVKEKLVGQDMTDVDEYTRRKTDVVLKILETAGWTEEELAPLREAGK